MREVIPITVAVFVSDRIVGVVFILSRAQIPNEYRLRFRAASICSANCTFVITKTWPIILGDEEAALGNSHPRNSSAKPVDGTNRVPVVEPIPAPSQERERTEEPERKEKSVLQAKLTKLAIQIGYAGMVLIRRDRVHVMGCDVDFFVQVLRSPC